jgi:hypothetical protein
MAAMLGGQLFGPGGDYALTDPEIAAKLASLGATVLSSSPAGAAQFIDEETEKWHMVVKLARLSWPSGRAAAAAECEE